MQVHYLQDFNSEWEVSESIIRSTGHIWVKGIYVF
jgi:hypothetical protein